MREIITDWNAIGTPGGVTVMYFDELSSINDQRAALANLWDGIDNLLYNATSWTIRQNGRTLAETTGTLTGTWSSAIAEAGVGAASLRPVSNSSQILLQWTTGAVRRGRLVRGRSFIPGLDSGNTTEGRLTQGAANTLTLSAQALAQAGVGFSVWSRPKEGSIGALAPVTGGAAWLELGVQKGRRA